MSRSRILCIMFSLSLIFTARLSAQAVNATMSGTIHDKTGAVIPSARVTLTNVDTNISQTVTASASGEYNVLNLAPAHYRLDVEAPGFAHYVQTGITLDVGQKANQEVALELGASSSTVSVVADTNAVEASDATLSDVVTGSEIRNLPLNSRNPYALIALTPGFSGSVGNNYNSISYSINGSRQGYTDVLVDGIPGGFPTVNGNSGVGVFPSVDAINQFRVLGQNYPAEFGRSLGGILNTAFKSGSNAFHGTLFEFARNSSLDANDYFSKLNGKALPSFQRNQFGGVLNGPILHDKLFFLVSAELLRQSSAISTTTTVPTLLQRQGDFSQTFTSTGALVKIYNPFSTRANPAGGGYIRDAFANNKITPALLSKVGQNVMNYYPLPNATGNTVTGANNYFATTTEDNRIDGWDVRLDYTLPHSQTLFARYSDRFYDDTPQPFFPAAISKAENRIEQRDWMRNFVVDYTIAPSSHLLYDVRLGFSRALYDYLNAGLGFQATDLGLPAAVANGGGLPIFPVFTASGYVQLGNTDNRHNAFMTYSLPQSLTWVRGNHTFKFGLDARLIRVNDRETRDTSGNFAFTSSFTQGPNPSAASVAAGNSIASMLLGTGTGDLIQNFKDVASQSYYYGAYAQDDWRITPKLTLSFGLRYDLDTPRTDRYNRINYFDPTAPSPLAQASGITGLQGGLVFVGVNGRDRHQTNYDTNNFAPRFGLAYAVDPKTVIHAAFGIVYGPSPQAAAGTVGPFGFRVQNTWVSTLDNITPYYTLDNPFPSGFQAAPGASQGLATGAGGQIEGFLRNTVTPYAEQYLFNIDRELPGNSHLQLGYAGNHGLKLQQSREGGIDFDQLPTSALSLGSKLNDLVPNPFFGVITSGTLAAAQVSRGQLLKPYPQFTSVLPLFQPGGQTKYDALQVKYDKRFGAGLQVNASYVFSKTFDTNTTHQDSYNPSADYAVAGQHTPHRLVAGYTYQLPVGIGRHFGGQMPRSLDAVIGGWQVNGISTFQSGNPLQITASNVSGLGNPTEYANYDGTNPSLSGDIHNRLAKYFNTAAFSQPAAFTLGNSPAYVSRLLSPRLVTTDFSLFKEFHPYRETSLQLRAEAFNAFNHVQFGNPNTSVNSTSFGQITSQANSPRQLQFGAKLLF
jgi:hypothetical protein